MWLSKVSIAMARPRCVLTLLLAVISAVCAGGDDPQDAKQRGWATTLWYNARFIHSPHEEEACATVVEQFPKLTPDEQARFWDAVSLRAGAEALPKLKPPWDAVIVDEGQDFAEEDWLLARELAGKGLLWAFMDPAQSFWPERRLPAGLFQARFRLNTCYRCPPEILALARMFTAPVPAAADVELAKAGVSSGRIGIVACPSASSERDKVAQEIEKLRSEGLALSDIAVVSLRGQTSPESVVHAPRLGNHVVVGADDDAIESSVVAETFLRYKGLERPAIIVADLGLVKDRLGVRMHIAVTRALDFVRIVAAKEALSKHTVLGQFV